MHECCGGLAAALAASDLGRQVVLTEAGSWLGGQLTSQAVPPDEHPWVEHTGATARYRQLREAVRARYKRTRRLTESAKQDPLLNPGAAWVSNLSAEPVVFREVLDDLVRPAQAQGTLRCLMRHRPVAAAMDGDQVAAVTVQDSHTSENVTITASYVLDATDEGDLLLLTGCESIIGAESVATTGEPHALDGPPDPHRTSRRSRGARRWSGDPTRTTSSSGLRGTNSGDAIGPSSGRGLSWAG